MPGPANLTYDSLVTDLASYAERKVNETALAEQTPRLIMLAENRIATSLRILGFRSVVENNFSANNPVVAKPAYWRRTEELNLTSGGQRAPIFLRTYGFCRKFWPDATQTGVPRYYADYDFDNFFFAPTPASALEFELSYIARLQPLSSSDQENWMTANAPQLLLNACLLELEIWLKNFRNVDARQKIYEDAVNAFKTEDGTRVFDNSVVFA